MGWQALRESYTLRSQSVKASTSSVQSGQTQPKNKPGTERSRICRNYNTGAWTRAASHVSKGIMYNHFCTFCSQSGARNAHTEMDCKRKLSIKPVRSTDLSWTHNILINHDNAVYDGVVSIQERVSMPALNSNGRISRTNVNFSSSLGRKVAFSMWHEIRSTC